MKRYAVAVALVSLLSCRARYPQIEALAIGRTHSYARMQNGRVFKLQGKAGAVAVDKSEFPPLATVSPECQNSVPATVSDVVEVGCGDDFGCARRKNGSVACWGNNEVYQLARPEQGKNMPADLVFGILEATHLFVGGRSACVTLREGGAKCWGANDNGQLGDGRSIHHNVPVYVRILKSGV